MVSASFLAILLVASLTSLTDGARKVASLRAESTLINNLREGYVREARPVSHPRDSVAVSLQISFVSVEDLDENKNLFTSTVLLVQTWKDPRLVWDPAAHSGIKTIRLPVKMLWVPDIVPYNTASIYAKDAIYDDVAHVLSDGTVFWVPMLTVTTKCPMNVEDFPFDTQHCQIVFGSWVHSSADVSMKFLHTGTLEVDMTSSASDGETAFPFALHPHWELTKAKARLQNVSYTCCEDPFTLMTVSAHLKRRSTFYRCLALGPGFVFGLLVPFLFLMPSRSAEKTTYGLLLILGVTLLILTLQDAIPFTHSSVPKIGYFYLGTMGLSACTVLMSIFISNLSMRGRRHRQVPAWLHWLFLGRSGFHRLLCFDNYQPVDNIYSISLKDLEDSSAPEAEQSRPSSAQLDERDTSGSELGEIRRYLRYLVGKQSASDAYRNVCQDWDELARVFDRILFIIFLVFYVVFVVNLVT